MVDKVKRYARTVYFTEEMNQILDERAALTDRTISAEAERLMRKGLASEMAEMTAGT